MTVSKHSESLVEERTGGHVAGIFITTAASEPMVSLDHVRAVAGRGLEGDRYFLGTGFYSDGREGRQLTLIEAEDLERLEREHGVHLAPHECRRNIITRSVDLQALVGRRFRIGEVECEGIRLCPPCVHLEELTRPGMLKGLARSGGLRAHILTHGVIRVGERILAGNDRASSGRADALL